MNELVQQVKNFLASRKSAYTITFNLSSPQAVTVLEDLAHFCRAHETAFDPDPRIHAVAEGRREVWLRIQRHLNLDTEQLWQLYKRKDVP